jgi:hypothetical protein
MNQSQFRHYGKKMTGTALSSAGWPELRIRRK